MNIVCPDCLTRRECTGKLRFIFCFQCGHEFAMAELISSQVPSRVRCDIVRESVMASGHHGDDSLTTNERTK